MANTIKPFVYYSDFQMSDISEIRGDVRFTKVTTDYVQHFCDGVRVSKIEYVKVIAYPTEGSETRIAFSRHSKTEEGGFTRYESIEQDGGVWILKTGSYGRDCDGFYEDHYKGCSDGWDNPDYSNRNFPGLADASVITDGREIHRDYTAEAMGY